MKVFLLVLILCLSGSNLEAEATEHDDSSLFMEANFPESEADKELDSLKDDTSDNDAFLNEKHLSNGFTTRNPFNGRFTTRRPFTTRNPFPFTTRRPFTTRNPFRRRLICYSCSPTGSIRGCVLRFARIQYCPRNYMCMFAKGTLRRSGRAIYVAGCAPIYEGCQRWCDKSLRSGRVTRCSIRCCFRDLCNSRGLLSTPRPFTTRRPTRHRIIVRVLWKILRATKNIIEALTILLKTHMNHERARGFKREVVSMMSKVDFHAKQLGDSRDPEVLRLKLDVSQTRMQARAIIKKLDEFIDKVDPNADNNK